MVLRHQVVRVGGGRRVHRDDVRALQELGEVHRLHAVLTHDELLDVRVVRENVEPERPRPHRDCTRHVAERDEAEGLAHQPGELG